MLRQSLKMSVIGGNSKTKTLIINKDSVGNDYEDFLIKKNLHAADFSLVKQKRRNLYSVNL